MDRHDIEWNRCFKLFYGSCVPGGQPLVDSLPVLCMDARLDHVLRRLSVPGSSRRPLTARARPGGLEPRGRVSAPEGSSAGSPRGHSGVPRGTDSGDMRARK